MRHDFWIPNQSRIKCGTRLGNDKKTAGNLYRLLRFRSKRNLAMTMCAWNENNTHEEIV